MNWRTGMGRRTGRCHGPRGGSFFSWLILLTWMLLSAANGATAAGTVAASYVSPDKLRYVERPFTIPKAERIILDNGLILYFLEDHEVPLVTISSVIRTGSIYDPPGKEGLAELTARVMRTGGAADMTGEMIDEELDYLAATLNVSMNRESGTASLSILKKDFDRGLQIFAQVLMAPTFAEERLKLAKDLKIEELKRVADDPQRLAFREFNRILYRNNARGRLATPASVRTVQKEDLASFHRQFFTPDHILLAVTGDLTRDEAVAKIERALGGWRSRGGPVPLVDPPVRQKGGIYFLAKDVPQAVIVYGNLAPKENENDYYPFEILDFAVGSGGFKSRIFQEVRTERGLAYSTGSFYYGRKDYGVFGAYALTKSESAAAAVSLIRSILSNVKQEGVRKDEFARTKKSIINRFIFSFLSVDQIAFQKVMTEFDGLPDDYLGRYRERIRGVRREDVNEVASRYLLEDDAVFFVLGQDKIYEELHALLGDVSRIEESPEEK